MENTVQIPIIDNVKDENPVWLDSEQISRYRSHVARCLFLSQDSADITFAVNELCRRMSDPSQTQYLKGERHWIRGFQIRGREFRSDSFQTRKPSSAGVALVGQHLLKSVHKKREDHRQKQRRQSCVQQHWERQKRRMSRA